MLHSNEKVNYRQKGKSISGKVYKGFIQEASSKVSVGTIPSKFETIIYKNSNSKAFNSSTTRFFEREEDRPGPGQYKKIQAELTYETHGPSESKKGYGNGFIPPSSQSES